MLPSPGTIGCQMDRFTISMVMKVSSPEKLVSVVGKL